MRSLQLLLEFKEWDESEAGCLVVLRLIFDWLFFNGRKNVFSLSEMPVSMLYNDSQC